MLITTTEKINGRECEPLGIVRGSTVQTVNAIRDIGAGLKTLVGGELTKYNEMMDNARRIATERMMADAQAVGADAVVGVRYTTSSIMQGAAEVLERLSGSSDDESRSAASRSPGGKDAGFLGGSFSGLLPGHREITMTLEEECRLSYYREIAVLDREHRVSLVQHGETGRIYVKKVLSVCGRADPD